jgi:hypothetical protein
MTGEGNAKCSLPSSNFPVLLPPLLLLQELLLLMSHRLQAGKQRLSLQP